jgi:hypothetical protein
MPKGGTADAYPLIPRTCHHFVPPTTRLAAASPPRAFIKRTAALSQQDIGIVTLTTCIQGGAGVLVFENAWTSSTVCLDANRESDNSNGLHRHLQRRRLQEISNQIESLIVQQLVLPKIGHASLPVACLLKVVFDEGAKEDRTGTQTN